MNLFNCKQKLTKEDLSLPIAKNTGTLIKQSQTKEQMILKNRLIKPRESFSFDIPLQPEDVEFTLGLTSLEAYPSFFTITKKTLN